MPNQKKYAFFFVFTLCICVLAIYIYKHRQGRTGRVDNVLISGTGLIQRNLYYLGHGSRALVQHYLLLVHTQQQNEELQKELDYLRTKVAALQEVELENARVKKMLDFRDTTEQKLLPAHVIAQDVSNDYFGIRIDRGLQDGVQVGMGVISPSGLVGRVLRAAAHYSDVLTLVDPTSNIDSVIQRSRARGIITGQNKQLSCKMKYVDRQEDVQVGDTVVSSGFGDIFPKGLLVGYVTAVIPNPNGILQTITIKAAVDIYRLEEVFIVFPPAQPKTDS